MLTILSVTETVTATRIGLIDRLPSLEVHFNKFHKLNAGHIPEFQINSLIHSLERLYTRFITTTSVTDHGYDGAGTSRSFYDSTIPHQWCSYNLGCSKYVHLHYRDSVLSSLSSRVSRTSNTREKRWTKSSGSLLG